MLRSISELKDYPLIDQNVELVGQVHDVYFDDLTWTVRYLVVDTGAWLPGRKVLISPVALDELDLGAGVSLRVKLTREQIEQSPPVDPNKLLSRQQEVELIEHYQWPDYRQAVTFFEASAVGLPASAYLDSLRQGNTGKPQAPETVLEKTVAAEQTGDPHLRSTNEVMGYYIQARDGDIGHVENFLINNESWAVHYLIVDTRNWWPGKKVLVSPSWVEEILWDESQVSIDLNRETIKNSPEYDPDAPVDQVYQTRLNDYYGQSRAESP